MIKYPSPTDREPRLLEQVAAELRRLNRSEATIDSYTRTILKFILHHGKRHPRDLTGDHVAAYLTHRANAEVRDGGGEA